MATEVVKNEESGIAAKPRQWWGALREFFRDTAAELKKVTWPSRNEVVGTTVVVVVATILFAIYLSGCDWVFYKAVDFLLTRFGAAST